MRWLVILAAIGGAAILAMLFIDLAGSTEAPAHARRETILRALALAKEVRIVELAAPESKSVVLEPEQVLQLAEAMPCDPDCQATETECSFTPQYRLEVTRPDGSKLHVEFCFKCNKFHLNDEAPLAFPLAWREPLQTLFTQLGVDPKRQNLSE